MDTRGRLPTHSASTSRSAMPACAGVALGIERLLMALAGRGDIREVLAFGFDAA